MIVIKLHREDAEAIAGDLHRASVNAALDVDNDERQGIASDLNAILRIFNDALEADERNDHADPKGALR